MSELLLKCKLTPYLCKSGWGKKKKPWKPPNTYMYMYTAQHPHFDYVCIFMVVVSLVIPPSVIHDQEFIS